MSQSKSYTIKKNDTLLSGLGMLPIPTRTGYDFDGWYTQENGCGGLVQDTMEISNDITFYAKWIPNTVTLSWNDNGGNHSPSEWQTQIEKNTPLLSFPETAKLGYTLSGWYTQQTGGEQIPLGYIVRSNQTLHAQWNATQYQITYQLNGHGQVDNSNKNTKTTYTINDATYTPQPIVQDGYQFNGWTPESIPSGTTGDVTFNANWSESTYTVTWRYMNGDNDSIEYSRDIPFGTRLYQPIWKHPGAGFYVGHAFLGWFTEQDGAGEKLDEGYRLINDITLYGNWEIREYTIVFNSNGGSLSEKTRVVQHGSTIGELPYTELTGYTFVGWYSDPGLNNVINNDTIVTSNMSCYAKWNINQYTITYDMGGHGSEPVGALKTYNINTRLPYTPEWIDSEEGWRFIGWTPQYLPENSIGNFMFSARWMQNAYSVTFHINGFSSDNQVVYKTHGDVIDEFPEISQYGMKLTGWFTQEEGEGDRIDAPLIVTHDIDLYPLFELSESKITYELNGHGTLPADAPTTYTVNDDVIPPEMDDVVGYEFKGWSPQMIYAGSFGDIIFTAEWQIKTFTITLLHNDGTEAKTQKKIQYGNPLGELPELTRPGYQIVGWYASDNTTLVNSDTIITGTETFHPNWIAIEYSITYKVNDEEILPNGYLTSYTIESPKYTPENLTLEGHDFSGWNPTSIETGSFGNIVFLGTLIPKTYTITFNVNGGDELPASERTTTRTHGQNLIYDSDTAHHGIPTPTRTNHIFMGWFNGVTKVDENTIVTSNMTLIAQWVDDSKATITFRDNIPLTLTYDSNY